MVKNNIDKLFLSIESAYFEDNYRKVVEEWETINKAHEYSFSWQSENEIKILQALVVSYSELGDYNKSINYANIYIQQFGNIEKGDTRNWEDLNFYFLTKVTNLAKQRKWVKEYQTLLDYKRKGGKDDNLINILKPLEEKLFNKYKKCNLYFIYIFIGIIIANNILRYYSNAQVNETFMLIFSTIGVLWILSNFFSNELSLKIFRRLLAGL